MVLEGFTILAGGHNLSLERALVFVGRELEPPGCSRASLSQRSEQRALAGQHLDAHHH